MPYRFAPVEPRLVRDLVDELDARFEQVSDCYEFRVKGASILGFIACCRETLKDAGTVAHVDGRRGPTMRRVVSDLVRVAGMLEEDIFLRRCGEDGDAMARLGRLNKAEAVWEGCAATVDRAWESPWFVRRWLRDRSGRLFLVKCSLAVEHISGPERDAEAVRAS